MRSRRSFSSSRVTPRPRQSEGVGGKTLAAVVISVLEKVVASRQGKPARLAGYLDYVASAQPKAFARLFVRAMIHQLKRPDATESSETIAALLLRVAARVGYDGRGKGERVGYFLHLLESHPRLYGQLLGQLLDYELKNPELSDASADKRTFTTVEELEAELRRRGLPPPPRLPDLRPPRPGRQASRPAKKCLIEA